MALGDCARPPATLPIEPGVTFAAHPAGGGFVVDRTQSGAPAVLTPAGRLHAGDAPDFVLHVGDDTRGALWAVGHSRLIVRAEPSTRSARTGEVLSTWDGGAIRLVLYGADGRTLRTDTFVRDGEGPPATLSRLLAGGDASGAYRAVIRDSESTPVGWLRVRIAPPAPASYDAALPPGVDDAVAAAAVVALDREIGWIADHGGSNSEEQELGDHDAERDAGGEDSDDHLGRGTRDLSPGALGCTRQLLHPRGVDPLDALLRAGTRDRLDALLGSPRDRRDRLPGRSVRRGHRPTDGESEDEGEQRESHGGRA